MGEAFPPMMVSIRKCPRKEKWGVGCIHIIYMNLPYRQNLEMNLLLVPRCCSSLLTVERLRSMQGMQQYYGNKLRIIWIFVYSSIHAPILLLSPGHLDTQRVYLYFQEFQQENDVNNYLEVCLNYLCDICRNVKIARVIVYVKIALYFLTERARF